MPVRHLTDSAVRSIQAGHRQVDYWATDLQGFGLRVSPGGRKAWVLRYRLDGRQSRLTLGVYPHLTLADARSQAKRALGDVAHHTDPAALKQVEREAGTFGALAEVYIEKHAKVKKRSWEADERIIKAELLPVLRHLKVKNISRGQVRELVEAVVERGAPIMANRVLALIRKMLNVAIDREWIATNVASRMAKPSVERQRADRGRGPCAVARTRRRRRPSSAAGRVLQTPLADSIARPRGRPDAMVRYRSRAGLVDAAGRDDQERPVASRSPDTDRHQAVA
jgi:hypothetical protein